MKELELASTFLKYVYILPEGDGPVKPWRDKISAGFWSYNPVKQNEIKISIILLGGYF